MPPGSGRTEPDNPGDRRGSSSRRAGLSVREKTQRGFKRHRPGNLAFAQEDDYFDLFGVYAVNHNLTLTAGYADPGPIASFGGQRGLYLSTQIGF